MKNESKKHPARTIVYITRDLERALPLLGRKSTYIVSNTSPFAKKLAKKYKGLFLISNEQILDTRELLSNKKVIDFIDSLADVSLVVFKSTPAIENICKEHRWKLLNPPSELSSTIEEKISQIDWLHDAADLLPPHTIISGSSLRFEGENFIIQFNRAHTGSGTILINSTAKANEISNKFPNRPLRKTKLISGPVFTSNNIISGTKILSGPISYQITGMQPFTDNGFSTIGNDWSLPAKLLSKKNLKEYEQIVKSVGQKMIQSNWSGLFGIDTILDETSGHLYLLEINARQPASTSFESTLQKKLGESTMELHLKALIKDKDIPKPKNIKNGAQIILRNGDKVDRKSAEKIARTLEKLGFSTIFYRNETPNTDLLRIMSKKGIMSNHNEFNKIGLSIKQAIEKYV
jgi:hypothetical protein